MAQLVTARDHQDALLRIYRALPGEYDQINTGDWVTLSRDYAEQHAAGEGWPVIYADVPAHQVFTDGNDLAEFGYTGPTLESLPQLPEDTEPPAPAQQPHQVEDRDQQMQISPDSLDSATTASPHVVGPHTPLARQDQHGTITARIDALTARVNAGRDQDNNDSHPRTSAAQQRWDDGPAAHQQAPTHHQ